MSIANWENIRNAIECLYSAKMWVTEYVTQKDQVTRRMVTTEIMPEDKQDIPCRLSFNSFPQTEDQETAPLRMVAKIFCSPDIAILAGSKITVQQNNTTYVLKNSGIPAVHETHQEIICENWEENA